MQKPKHAPLQSNPIRGNRCTSCTTSTHSTPVTLVLLVTLVSLAQWEFPCLECHEAEQDNIPLMSTMAVAEEQPFPPVQNMKLMANPAPEFYLISPDLT